MKIFIYITSILHSHYLREINIMKIQVFFQLPICFSLHSTNISSFQISLLHTSHDYTTFQCFPKIFWNIQINNKKLRHSIILWVLFKLYVFEFHFLKLSSGRYLKLKSELYLNYIKYTNVNLYSLIKLSFHYN